ncbi:MAG: sigma factor [Planctomycetota bacterium]|nr:sigma factor [Planctomycetota bacterium]
MIRPQVKPTGIGTGYVRFQTASWSLVANAGGDGPGGRAAIDQLCGTYWSPLYVFLRGLGQSQSDAEDIVQSFFIHLLEDRVLEYADQDRGRFRTFLIAAIKQFVAREHVRRSARLRKPDRAILSHDFGVAEQMYSTRGQDEKTPEVLFDRAWALTLLDQTVTKLRDEYARADKVELFEKLLPALTSDRRIARDVSAQLQMSGGAVRVAVHRLRKRYGTILRRLISETVQDPSEVDDELHALMRAISR